MLRGFNLRVVREIRFFLKKWLKNADPGSGRESSREWHENSVYFWDSWYSSRGSRVIEKGSRTDGGRKGGEPRLPMKIQWPRQCPPGLKSAQRRNPVCFSHRVPAMHKRGGERIARRPFQRGAKVGRGKMIKGPVKTRGGGGSGPWKRTPCG